MRRWLPILLFSFVGALSGILTGATLIFGTSDPLALISSLGALAAASAAFLTINEMKAARILSARARVGFATAGQPLDVRWEISRNEIKFPSGSASIMLRNTTSGTANEAHEDWEALVKISQFDIESIRSMLAEDTFLEIADNRHQVNFSGPNHLQSLPLSGTSRRALGDIGPAQEWEVQIPAVISNYAMLKWLSLFKSTLAGEPVHPSSSPRFSLSIRHNNMYEREIVDVHHIRFSVARFAIDGEENTSPGISGLKEAELLEFTLVPEIWSEMAEDDQIVVV